jgi:hypothetical protein
MLRRFACVVGVGVSALLVVGLIAYAQEKPKEGEKKMQAEQVPPAALATIKDRKSVV